MEYILWFDQVKEGNFSLVGGKAYNLGIMTQLKLPVPPGFNVITKAFDEFLEITGIESRIKELVEGCEVENTKQLLETSNQIKQLIVSQEMPVKIRAEVIEAYHGLSYSNVIVDEQALKLIASGRDVALVAVRSSATAEDLPGLSFAGQQATFLNVKGVRDLIDAVKKCWASLYESRAIFYRAKNNISDVSICVIVQKMINSEKSGVVFTVNPTTSEDQIIIEACWGLGETIVQGEVEPDRYTVSKTKEIIDKKIGQKLKRRIRDFATDRTIEVPVPKQLIEAEVLTNQEILKLAEYGLQLEKHYNKAQDIEFAIENSRIYITQTRAVTTQAKKEEEVKPKGEPILKGLGASPGSASGTVRIVKTLEDLIKIQQGDILVTKMTSPDMVVTMNRCAAIITNEGGMTCHAAIVTREMGIPCIVGTGNGTEVLKDGETITVNASNGLVYRGKVEGTAVEEEVSVEEVGELTTRTKILMNLGVPEKIDEYKSLPFQGIGLMRIEFIIATHIGEHPNYLLEIGEEQKYIDKLAEGIAKVAEAIHPRFVVVRFSDFKTNEYRDLKGGEKFEPVEANPMLGWRGVSRYVSPDFEKAFRLECKAVKKVREEMGLDNVWVMLPFVRTTWEVEKCLAILTDEGLEKSDDFKIWIMAEVPSVIFLAEEFSKLCDGFSIGSNDLTQLIMGADRDSGLLGSMGYFDERNVAVLRAIAHLIKVAHANGVTVSICGQAPSVYPEITEFLIKCGIDSISVNHDVVAKTKKMTADIEKKIELEKSAMVEF